MRAWDEFLQEQQEGLGSEVMERWVRPLRVVRYDAANLYLEAQDHFQLRWFEEHMRPRLRSFCNQNRRPIQVHVQLAQDPAQGQPVRSKGRPAATGQRFELTFDSIDPYCTLSHWVTSSGNQLAHRLLADLVGYGEDNEQLRQVQLGQYNPVYLYGPSGSGKTHLLMAAAAFLKKRGYPVIYTRAQTFTEQVVSAIRAGEMATLRKTYRHAQILLIDDIQVLARKAATQEELFHTFNTLHTDGRQILLSGDCPPHELKGIEPRLMSRFEWGIVLPVIPLQEEQLCQALTQRARALHYPLSAEVAQLLAENFKSSPKSAQRALEALVLRTHLQDGQQASLFGLTVEQVQRHLADLLAEEKTAVVTPQRVVAEVSRFFGIPIQELMGRSRSRDCSTPRKIAMHLCRSQLQLPYTRIGELFGRDHSTVMTSVRHIQRCLDEREEEVCGSIGAVSKALQAT
jgi:chromosomal replication initiator protein